MADAKIFFFHISLSPITSVACVPPSSSSFALCLLPVQTGSLYGKIWLVTLGEDTDVSGS